MWIFLLVFDISLSQLGECAWGWIQRGISSHFPLENRSLLGIISSRLLIVVILQRLCSFFFFWHSWDTFKTSPRYQVSEKFSSALNGIEAVAYTHHLTVLIFLLPGRNKQKSTGHQLSSETLFRLHTNYDGVLWIISLFCQWQHGLTEHSSAIYRGPARFTGICCLYNTSSSSDVVWGVLKMK